MFSNFEQTLTFDDVLMVPQSSSVLPAQTELASQLTDSIKLNLPIMSAAMDTVTEHEMAISMALSGGIGVIHKNLSIEEQVEQVNLVKRFENGFIEDPLTVLPTDSIAKVADIKEKFGYKKVPVVDERGLLVGIIRDIDYFVPNDEKLLVHERMTLIDKIIVANHGINLEEANKKIIENKIKTLCLIDGEGKLRSIVTRRDMEKNVIYPHACKNEKKQLRVAAAVSVGEPAMQRAGALVKAEVDALVVDTAHGHSSLVIETVRELRELYPQIQIIAGNIATAEAAIDLIEAGANAVKVGIGPGSICTTRVVSGVGVPQFSAIRQVVEAVKGSHKQIRVIADGGIKTSGDVVKALAAGATAVMIGNLFAGTDEAPGRVEFVGGKMYKVYRGMGSLEAMEQGGKDRYGQADVTERKKFVPEGVSGKVLYKGPVDRIIYQLAGGIRSGMGYCGARTIDELHRKARFIKISSASLKENHPHDLQKFDSAPNYSGE
ncbi:MAG: IMP dehydrogenase [bacterium]